MQQQQSQPTQEPKQARKPYETPAILHDLALETRAGSPPSLSVDPVEEILGIPTK